jgi:UDP-glucose 4-epimerase
MNYLVTGGNGFIGKNLVNYLLKKKSNKVFVIDSSGSIKKNKNLFFLKGKISNKILIKLNKINFDFIYHLGALLGVEKVIKYPEKIIHENYISTKLILEYAKTQTKLKRFFFASTSELYSHGTKRFEERENLFCPKLDHPRTSYWLSKLTGEFLVTISGTPYTNFRIFNAYGPYMKKTHVIPEAFHKIRMGKLVFYNPGHVRCFIYIDDLIKMIISTKNKSFLNKTINLGNPNEPIKMRDLIYKIKNISGNNYNKQIKFLKSKNNSISFRKPNISLYLKLKKSKFKKFTKLNLGLNRFYKSQI